MKSTIPFFISLLLNCGLVFSQPTSSQSEKQNSAVCFHENKGQVSDQFFQPRNDVLFSGQASGFVFHLRKNGASYQIQRQGQMTDAKDAFRKVRRISEASDIYRLDIEWLNANPGTHLVASKPLPGHTNFYLQSCPSGVEFVKSFEEVRYYQLYKGIDLRYYVFDNDLKYDLIVSPGFDYKKIAFEVKGATRINIDKDGSLVYETPFGRIKEGAPLVFQANKKRLASWKIKGNTVSFDIQNVDPNLALVIDPPIRVWGTFYGGTLWELGQGCATDTSDNVFMTGLTQSAAALVIATTGAHQTNHAGGNSNDDAFLVKFNSGGVRQWGTYYGGSAMDIGNSCAADAAGNVFMTGSTTSSASIASGGYQTAYGGHPSFFGSYGDAFLVKFNSAGVRQWATYYGSTDMEEGNACAVDPSGNIYMTGFTGTQFTGTLATSGAHQVNFAGGFDAFLVKFSTTGSRLWATYYGGSGGEYGYGCATDTAGNVFMSGTCTSNTINIIATPGAHQTTVGKGFVVKFNMAGVRQWGTYYAGVGNDYGYGCATDKLGNVYFTGQTSEPTSTLIATSGCHQPNLGGVGDGFMVKFNGAGVRQWGTYYGGSNYEEAKSCAADNAGNILMVGTTSSPGGNVFSYPNSHQPIYGGSQFDAFLVKFNPAGQRVIATYYGGVGNDYGYGCTTDKSGRFYICGESHIAGPFEISTNNGHQPNNDGSFDAYLVQFEDCLPAPVITTALANRTICPGTTTTLTATGNANIYWYNSLTSTNSIGIGASFITPTLSAGVYTFFAESFACLTGAGRAAVTVTVFPSPSVQVSDTLICIGETFSISPSGAQSYTISGGSYVVSPPTSTAYIITGSSAAGCTASAVSNITVVPLPLIQVAPLYTVCSGTSINLVATGAASYTWNGVFAGNPYNVTPIGSSQYSVSGDNIYGCKNSTTTLVQALPLPTVQISQFQATICLGQSSTLTVFGAATYTWNTASNQNQIVISPVGTTVFSVNGTSSNGCATSASITQFVDPCSGMEESYNSQINLVYPNPTIGRIEFLSTDDGKLSVVNILGIKLASFEIRSGTQELDFTEYPAGTYFLFFESRGANIINKLVKH